MKSKAAVGLLVGTVVAIAACTTAYKSGKRGVAGGSGVWTSDEARRLDEAELERYATSSAMNVKNARLITDNYQSFQSKLSIIKSAKAKNADGSQGTLKLVYYIFADDFSSSEFSSELLKAAKRGVKVSILVDFITNYERLDLFRYLEQQGAGNLKVKFYGTPAMGVLRGAVYQTAPCSKYDPNKDTEESCKEEKLAFIEKMGNPVSTWFSKMYLTGMYGKNNVLMGTSTQLGGQFDPRALAIKDPNAPKIPKEDMQKIGKLLVDAKIKNDFGSKIKLGFALSAHGDVLKPVVNEFTGRLPINVVWGSEAEKKQYGDEWDHLTDYTHHKLLIANGEKFQLGGRNIEDSYHTEKIKEQLPESRGKYTFLDTDFYAETPSAKQIEAQFDKLFNFDAMVGDFAEVDKYVPNEYDVNTEAFQAALQACLMAGQQDLENCTNNGMKSQPKFRTLAKRMSDVGASMAKHASDFRRYKSAGNVGDWNPAGDRIADKDAKVYYIENLSFNKGDSQKRIFGSRIGQEAEHGKGIHAAWVRGIENACAANKPQRVILHTAYFFLPSNLINALGKATDGTWNCSQVQIDIITNSAQTTDLAPVNIMARYQLKALIEHDWAMQNGPAADRKAKLKYFEYLAGRPKTAGRSLHTKLSVLGDDMIIGSANSDARSYYMDTNNGVFIRNAPQFIADYIKYVDSLKVDGPDLQIWEGYVAIPQFGKNPQTGEEMIVGISDPISYAGVTLEQLEEENKGFVFMMGQRWLAPKPEELAQMTPEQIAQEKTKAEVNKQRALQSIKRLGRQVYEATQGIIQKSGDSESLDNLANKFDRDWKVL